MTTRQADINAAIDYYNESGPAIPNRAIAHRLELFVQTRSDGVREIRARKLIQAFEANGLTPVRAVRRALRPYERLRDKFSPSWHMDDGFGYHHDGRSYYANGTERQAPRPATIKQINEWRAQQ